MQTWSRGSAVFRPNVRMGRKCDLDRGMILGARQGGLYYLRSCCSTGIFTHNSLEFAKNGVKNKKHPVSSSSVCKNTGQRRRARLIKVDRKVTVMHFI